MCVLVIIAIVRLEVREIKSNSMCERVCGAPLASLGLGVPDALSFIISAKNIHEHTCMWEQIYTHEHCCTPLKHRTH